MTMGKGVALDVQAFFEASSSFQLDEHCGGVFRSKGGGESLCREHAVC